MQIVADQHGRKLLAAEGPHAGFKIDLPYVDMRVVAQPGQPAHIDIDSRHRMAVLGEQTGVPSFAACQIKHLAASRNQVQEALYPGRWFRLVSRCWAAICHASVYPAHAHAASASLPVQQVGAEGRLADTDLISRGQIQRATIDLLPALSVLQAEPELAVGTCFD